MLGASFLVVVVILPDGSVEDLGALGMIAAHLGEDLGDFGHADRDARNSVVAQAAVALRAGGEENLLGLLLGLEERVGADVYAGNIAPAPLEYVAHALIVIVVKCV